MARTEKSRGKGKVKEIANALLNSEIPEIQAIVNELTERTKQLEAHSKKLQAYAAKIQELSGEEIDLRGEENLTERLRLLEKALVDLSGSAVKAAPKPPAETVREELPRHEAKIAEPPRSVPPVVRGDETFLTPEGFVVRRRRY